MIEPPLLTPHESDELDLRLRRAIDELDGVELVLDELRGAALDVARRRRAGAGPDASALELVPPFLPDFCLAYACRRRPAVERAWTLVVRRFTRPLLDVAREWDDGAPEDVVTTFLGELWVARPSRQSLLDTYMGLGPLGAWMVLVLRRRLARRARQRLPFVPLTEHEAADALSPEEQLAREELLGALRPILARFLASLSARDRELLEARVLRAERGIDTARRFGVSPAYVSRRFKEVVFELRERLTPSLAHRGLDPEDPT